MLVTRVQTESVASAVKATFDGQHPCPLCKAIKNARNQEKQKEAPLLKKSQELKLVESKSRSLLPIPFVSDEREWPDFILVALKRAEVPLTPPPNV